MSRASESRLGHYRDLGGDREDVAVERMLDLLPFTVPGWYGSIGIDPAAAAAKIFLGALFYGLWFLGLPSYPSIFAPLENDVREEIRSKMRGALTWTTGSIVGPFLFAMLAAWIFSVLWK